MHCSQQRFEIVKKLFRGNNEEMQQTQVFEKLTVLLEHIFLNCGKNDCWNCLGSNFYAN